MAFSPREREEAAFPPRSEVRGKQWRVLCVWMSGRGVCRPRRRELWLLFLLRQFDHPIHILEAMLLPPHIFHLLLRLHLLAGLLFKKGL